MAKRPWQRNSPRPATKDTVGNSSDPHQKETLLEVRAGTPPGMPAECPLDLRVSNKKNSTPSAKKARLEMKTAASAELEGDNLPTAEELDALAHVKNYCIQNEVTTVFCPELKMFVAYVDLPLDAVGGMIENSQIIRAMTN